MNRVPSRQECGYKIGVDDIDRAINTAFYFWYIKYKNPFVAGGIERTELDDLQSKQIEEELISPGVYKSEAAVNCIQNATQHIVRDETVGFPATLNLFNEILLELEAGGVNRTTLRGELVSRPGFYDSTFRMAQLAVDGSLEKAV